tara:strand:- start:8491 stop:8640 length:150 start_codon:yes stop_codon:yes gene_type:complete
LPKLVRATSEDGAFFREPTKTQEFPNGSRYGGPDPDNAPFPRHNPTIRG